METNNNITNEIKRIKSIYKKRSLSNKSMLYSFVNTGALYMQHKKEEVFYKILKEKNFEPLNSLVLDVGCGDGSSIRLWENIGVKHESFFGVEILPERLNSARKKTSTPENIIDRSITDLPFPDCTFDIVTQFTVFTSILDKKIKEQSAKEMLRVLKKDGKIIWYDFRYPSPMNKDVKNINKKEIKMLFPDANISFYKVTLLPPLARKLAPFSITFCRILEKIPLLCSHYYAVIEKK